MSFRLKTILGIAIIEGVLLLLLVWSSMDYLTRSNQEELTRHAETTSRLFATMAKTPVLATDLATLESVVGEMLNSPGVIYVRVMDNEQILSQGGDKKALARPFVRDQLFEQSADGIFDIGAEISEGGFPYGRVELGLSIAPLNSVINDARNRLLSIAAIEMLLVAIFSFFLGTYLTRSLNRLTKASHAIANGELGIQVKEDDSKEFKTATKAFNTMSRRLQSSQEEMSRSLEESHALAEKLSQSELRLKTTLDTAINGFITIDQKGVVQSVNRVGQEIFGYKESELIGKNVSCLMPAPYQQEHDGYLCNYLRTGEAKVIGSPREIVGLRKDGSQFPMSLHVSEMYIGDEPFFVGLVRDLSEQKQLEKAINRELAINNAIMAASLDALITIDRTGSIVEFSPVAEQTFGLSREKVLGRSIEKVIIPPSLRESHVEGFKHYFATGEGPVLGQRIEVPALRADGSEFPVELTVSPIEVDGEVLFTAFIRDISERKEAENQLKEAKREAESASEAKSRFLAHMSHEIRSPLNAVLGSVGLLMDTTLNEKQHLYAHTAETSGKALLGLINDVLDFSKIEAGQLELDHIKFNVRDLVAGVDEVVAYRAQENKSLEIVSVLGKGIPAQLIGDPGRLRQVLLNLMDNAAKFAEHGAVVLRVNAISTENKQPRLRFEVEDTGIGISEEAQQKLFSEFSQVDNSDSTRYGGTGLGLAICRQLVELMNGRIGLRSKLGQGSCFWFEIPYEAADDERGDVVPEHFGHRFLVVGLSVEAAEAVRDQWRVLGSEVDLVASAQEALTHLEQSGDYDYILVDEKLDVEHALFSSQLKSRGGAELVLISSSSLLDESNSASDWGYNRVIFRPLHLDTLLEAVRDTEHGLGTEDETLDQSRDTGVDESEFTLLLAEDSFANQMVATALLQNAGYRVDVANNGREAVEAFKRGEYDLILMDMRMPEMDGIEATECIRADGEAGEAIPILAMSANALQSDIDRCLKAGMNDYVTKPVEKENLLKAIRRALKTQATSTTMENEVMEDNTLPLLAEEALEKLAADTGPEQVPTMLAVFLDEGRARINRIGEGLESLSLADIREEAHVLKSLAGTFGAARLQVVARELEQACRDEQPEQAQRLGVSIISLFEKTGAVYQAHIDEAGA